MHDHTRHVGSRAAVAPTVAGSVYAWSISGRDGVSMSWITFAVLAAVFALAFVASRGIPARLNKQFVGEQ